MKTREAIPFIKTQVAGWLDDPENDMPVFVVMIAKKPRGGVSVSWAQIVTPDKLTYGGIVK